MTIRYSRLPVSPSRVEAWLDRGAAALRTIGFWSAVALPLVYLPLVALVPSAVGDPGTLAALLGANLAAIAVGHGHEA